MSKWRKRQQQKSEARAPQTDEQLGPLEMFHWSVNKTPTKQIKAVDSTVPFCQTFSLYDLSLNTKGPDEDMEFAGDKALRVNLRRGNTLGVAVQRVEKGKFVDQSHLILVKGQPFEITEVTWLRRGMRKFFDMSLFYIQQTFTPGLDTQGSFNGNFGKQFKGREEYMEELRKVIFYDQEEAMLREHATIDVYKTNKANGENAQVSYYPPLGAWIIASKNVSMAVRTEKDIEDYNLSRFQFARLIALEWFRIISGLSEDRRQELKEDLSGKTIVGEYVGHPDHQHLVRYNDTNVMFYAYTDHAAGETCLPPLQAFLLFKKYGLSSVKVELQGSYRSPSALYSALEQLFMKVSSEDISEGEEGSVLYFVKNSAPDDPTFQTLKNVVFSSSDSVVFPAEMVSLVCNAQKTLSLAKLKTLEYRIYRKLREKLKHYTTEKNAEQVMKSFRTEMAELIEGHTLPRPIDFYHEVARVALQFIAKNPSANQNLQDHYIDFLDKILARVSGKSETVEIPHTEIVLVTPPGLLPDEAVQNFAERIGYSFDVKNEWKINAVVKEKRVFRVIHAQRITPNFDKKTVIVYVGFCETGKQMCLQELSRLATTEVHLDNKEFMRYITEDSLDRLNVLWKSVEEHISFMRESFPLNLLVFDTLENAESNVLARIQELESAETAPVKEEAKQEIGKTKRVLVVIPMGIPGMGKTFLVNQLQSKATELGCTMTVVSSDVVRRQCMNSIMAKNHSRDTDEAFEQSAKKARSVFYDKVREGLRSKSQIHILFLDKNHPPNAIKSTQEELAKSKPADVQKLEMILLVPECGSMLKIPVGSSAFNYELSMTFLIQCLLRVRDRTDHETLIGSPAHNMSVVLMMFSMYRNLHFADYLGLGFQHIIKVQFTDEKQVYFPGNLTNEVTRVLAELKSGQKPEEEEMAGIVTALEHVPNAFEKVENCRQAVSAFADIIRKKSFSAQTQPAPAQPEKMEIDALPEETKTAQPIPAQKEAERINSRALDLKRIPVFLGVDLERWFGPCVLGLIRAGMFTLSETYRQDEMLQQDYAELIENPYAPLFAGAEHVSGSWAYPNSLHLTTKFIGGKRNQPPCPDLVGFRLDEDVTFRAKLLAYVPKKLICVLCDLLSPPISIENKFPHVTCLLSGWKAKLSGEVLNAISFEAGMQKQRVTVNGEEVDVYTVRLFPQWILKGVTKAYYN